MIRLALAVALLAACTENREDPAYRADLEKMRAFRADPLPDFLTVGHLIIDCDQARKESSPSRAARAYLSVCEPRPEVHYYESWVRHMPPEDVEPWAVERQFIFACMRTEDREELAGPPDYERYPAARAIHERCERVMRTH